MHEDLISFLTAKLAIGKGFEGIIQHSTNNETISGMSNVPHQAFLQRWLRELYGIDVLPYLVQGEEHPYCCMVFKDHEERDYLHSFKTYEEALEAGLYAGLWVIPEKPIISKVEDLKVINKKNKILDYARYCMKVEPFNIYPVMYVEGEPIWEGDQVLYHAESGKITLREIFWENRNMVANGSEWVSQFFLNINKPVKVITNG